MVKSDITVVTAVDRAHLVEAAITFPTWMHFKPQMLKMPLIVIYDSQELSEGDLSIFKKHPNVTCIPWQQAGTTQREEMLTSLVKIPATHVKTPWYLKIDVDTLATGPGPWIQHSWFGKIEGQWPAYIASPWGYSKPADILERLDNWADENAVLPGTNRMNVPFKPSDTAVRCPRIISWLQFGNTEWLRWAAQLFSDRMPGGSQDTYLFYLAARTKHHAVRVRMSHYNWQHVRRRMLQQKANEIYERFRLEHTG